MAERASAGYPVLPIGERVIIPARAARAFLVRAGQIVRVIDVAGQQVADFLCASAADPTEQLSGINSTQLNETVYLTAGHQLYSTRRQPMFTIVEDTVGRHDVLMGACSGARYEKAYGVKGHPNCEDLLRGALDPLGVRSDASDTFNVFMNVPIAEDGRLRIELPRSKADDHVALRAEMDCLVAISACPADLSPCNGWNPTPIGVEVLAPGG